MSEGGHSPRPAGRSRGLLRAALPVVAVVVVAFAYARLDAPDARAPHDGSAAPDLRLPGLDGRVHDLAAERGRVVIVNFWATWCPPCLAELPSLERLARALEPAGLSVLAVSTDEDAAALERFVAARRLSLTVLRDPGGRVASAAWGVGGYPVTFVIDRAGRIAEHTFGPEDWDAAERVAGLRALLAEESGSTGR